jgi:hypothetical protein
MNRFIASLSLNPQEEMRWRVRRNNRLIECYYLRSRDTSQTNYVDLTFTAYYIDNGKYIKDYTMLLPKDLVDKYKTQYKNI